MDNQENSIKVYLRVWGYDCRHEDITKELGLTPDQTLTAGEVGKGGGKVSRNMWSFESKLEKGTAEEHLEWLLEKLEPYKQAIASIASRYDTQISVYGRYFEYNPEVFLEADVITQIAELGVKLWFDTYCLQKDFLATVQQRKELEVALKESAVAHKFGITTDADRKAFANALSALEDVAQDIPIEEFTGDVFRELDKYWQEEAIKGAQEKLTKLADQIRDSELYIGNKGEH
jgi:chaperonin cofactor prefoldin